MSMQDESIVLSLPTSRRFSHFSPLRYPGGKASMTGFFALLIDELGLRKPVYVEPYAGGTGAGIALLLEEAGYNARSESQAVKTVASW